MACNEQIVKNGVLRALEMLSRTFPIVKTFPFNKPCIRMFCSQTPTFIFNRKESQGACLEGGRPGAFWWQKGRGYYRSAPPQPEKEEFRKGTWQFTNQLFPVYNYYGVLETNCSKRRRRRGRRFIYPSESVNGLLEFEVHNSTLMRWQEGFLLRMKNAHLNIRPLLLWTSYY